MNIRDRVTEFRRVPASQIRPSPHNWRTHPAAQHEALRGLLSELGFAGAVLARQLPDGALEAIDGHLRLETMGERPVPVLVTDLNEDEAKTLLAAFDPLGAMAGADAAKLDALLNDVRTSDAAVRAMLDDLARVNGAGRLGAGEPGAEGDEFDPTPEPDGPTRTQPGELWAIGDGHRLLVGDCTAPDNVARLMGEVRAALIVTDPPYGVDFRRGQFITDPSRRRASRAVGDAIRGDDRKGADQQAFIEAVFRTAAPHVLPGCPVYMFSASMAEGCHSLFGLLDAGLHAQSQLVWVKNVHALGQADYHWKHELCWYGWYPGPRTRGTAGGTSSRPSSSPATRRPSTRTRSPSPCSST